MSSFEQVGELLWRWRTWIAAFCIVGALAGATIDVAQGPRFSASSYVLVQDQNVVSAALGVGQGSSDPDRQLANASALATSPDVLKQLAARLARSPEEWENIALQLDVQPQTGSDALMLTVTSPSPDDAVLVANGAAQSFAAYYSNFVLPLAPSGQPQVVGREDVAQRIEVLRTVAPPGRVLSLAATAENLGPFVLRSGLIGLACGLILGVLCAASVGSLDSRVRTRSDVRTRCTAPILEIGPAEMISTTTITDAASFFGDRRGPQGPSLLLLLSPTTPETGARIALALSEVLDDGRNAVSVVESVPAEIESALHGARERSQVAETVALQRARPHPQPRPSGPVVTTAPRGTGSRSLREYIIAVESGALESTRMVRLARLAGVMLLVVEESVSSKKDVERFQAAIEMSSCYFTGVLYASPR